MRDRDDSPGFVMSPGNEGRVELYRTSPSGLVLVDTFADEKAAGTHIQETFAMRHQTPLLTGRKGDDCMYVYVQTTPNRYEVGFYKRNGRWMLESTHGEREAAAQRVSYLNDRDGVKEHS